VNAIGKSKKCPLVLVGKSEGLCFGNVGKHRFCRATECKIRKHQGGQANKFDMGCDARWFIPSKSQTLSDKGAAFKTHFLDAAKITDDTLSVLQDTMTRKKTAEWEMFNVEAKVEWEDFIARRPLCAVKELSSGEELEDDDSFESTEGDFMVYLTPDKFNWRKTLQNPPTLIITRTGSINEDIEELQAIMKDLSTTGPFALSTKAREDAVEVLEYVWGTVFDLIKAVDRLNKRVRIWKQVMGDFGILCDDREVSDICSGLSHTMSALDDVERGTVARFEEVLSRFEDWDQDNVQNLKHLNKKIKKMLQPPSTPVPSQVVNHQDTFALCVDTPIVDANGVQVGCHVQLMHELTLLRDENVGIRNGQVKMREELDAIKADVTAQGGVMLGHHTFSSKIQVLQIAMKECPQGDVFALFVDPVSIYCHDLMYAPVVGWEKTTKAMEESGVMSVTDRKVLASYNCNHAFWFTDGKPVVAGKVIGAFASAEKWSGTGGMDGHRVEMETSSETAGDCVQTGIADKLPAGSKLSQLAMKMLEHTQSWLSKVNKHLDYELTKLTQMHISPEEVLILLSEEVIIMFDRFYTIRRKRMEFIIKGTRVQYMVRCIWLTMQVHMAMDKFVCDGMKYNPAISAAFVCFLTKQMGNNVGAGIGGMITKLKSRLHAAEAAAKEALQMVKEASKRATGASTAADTCKTALAKINTVEMKTSPQDQDYDDQSTDRNGYPSYCDANFVGVTSYHTTHVFCCCCGGLAW
jgi:hypothetical protein